MLSKTEIALALEDRGVAKRNLVKSVLDGLAELAAEEIEAGGTFKVPGIATVKWGYTSPLTKGEKYKKGDTYVGFGGIEQIAEADSKPRKAAVKLTAAPDARLKRMAPPRNDAKAQSSFLKTRAGRRIASGGR